MAADEPRGSEVAAERTQRYGWPGITLIAVIVAAIALFGWASFWPMDPCSDPSCARARFTLALELDAFEEVPPIAFNFQTEEGPVSLQSILASGGIDITVTYDDLTVPYKAASGPLDRADLYQFVSAWRNRPAHGNVDAHLYALFTAGLISDKGEPLFGIMFDHAGREGFAVAPRTTQRFFATHESASIETLQLRTFIHELLHALNRDHADAAAMPDGRLTLEAPTRCIAQGKSRDWRLVEPPLMALSPATIRFFQSASSRNVLPGKQNSPYELRRASPFECESARANIAAVGTETRWRLAVRQLKRMFSIRAADAAEAVTAIEAGENEVAEETDSSVEIVVQAQPAAYPLGYPIAVRVSVRNTGGEPLPIKGRLNPGYGLLQLDHRVAGEDEWRTLQPLTWFEPTGESETLLAPGERTEEIIPIYFGEDGWTFNKAGEYQIRARLRLDERERETVSETVDIAVAAPDTEVDRAALQPLLDPDGELDTDLGRLLNFGGRIGRTADLTPLESVAALYGNTALGSALRLTLLSQRLRPTIDPRTGERPAPDFRDARSLLEDTCTDSGVAALTSELLEQRAELLPAGFREGIGNAAAAWDGTTPRGNTIPTYSDPALSPWGPSLHFCFNEANPRGEVARKLRTLGRELARAKPQRVVVVGHGDRQGTCRYNNALALRRAESIRAVLMNAGVSRRQIQVVSLGERRPLDFAASAAAHDANRRVEILVEGIASDAVADQDRLVPSCPAR